MSINRPRLTLRVLPRYPAAITGGEGIKVARTPAAATVALDAANLAELPDPSLPEAYALVFADGAHWRALLSKQAGSLYDTRALAALATIAPSVNYVRTFGHASVGDGGGALYKRRIGAPAHQGFFQSADGAFWELAEAPTVTPEMFGAIRNGVADDSAAINNAIAYAAARGGGTVQLLPGMYRVHSTVTLLTGVTLKGSGLRQSIIAIPSAWAGGHIINALAQINVAIENIVVFGNYIGANDENVGIRFFNVTNAAVRDCLVSTTTGDGILINGAEGLPVQNVVLERNALVNNHVGIFFFKNIIDCKILKNDVEDSRSHGISVDDATTADDPGNPDPLFRPAPCFRVEIDGNAIQRASKEGSAAGIAVSGTIDCQIHDNTIRSCGVNTGVVGTSKVATGIVVNSGQEWFNQSQNVSIRGNIISQIVGGGALTMAGVWSGNVVANIFDDCFLWPAPLSGTLVVVLDDNALGKHTKHIVVEGNTFVGNSQTTTACQFAPNVTGCRWGANTIAGGIATDLHNSGVATNLVLAIGAGPLPTFSAIYQNRLWLDTGDGKVKVGGAGGWIVVGTQA